MDLVRILVGTLAALVVTWLVIVTILWLNRPSRDQAMAALRLIPDVIGLSRRIAFDPVTPRSIKVALLILIGWLIVPIDPIPDFLPVIGQLDDVIVTVLILRWVARRLGRQVIRLRWPGTPESLALLERLLRWD
jgi:uncharacterized membrane protein YkvA (DUF1232 family)